MPRAMGANGWGAGFIRSIWRACLTPSSHLPLPISARSPAVDSTVRSGRRPRLGIPQRDLFRTVASRPIGHCCHRRVQIAGDGQLRQSLRHRWGKPAPDLFDVTVPHEVYRINKFSAYELGTGRSGRLPGYDVAVSLSIGCQVSCDLDRSRAFTVMAENACRGFPGMAGSIDCYQWKWKNCPNAWQGQFNGAKGTSTVREAFANRDPSIW